MSMDKVVLNNGIEMPCLGMGTWQVTDRETLCCLVQEAGNLGYRMIDTAAAYGNEISLGKTLSAETLRREEWFLSDKLWNTCRGYEEAIAACKKSMKKLKVDYLDAYLIHWPASAKLYENWQEVNAETWRAMETLYREGYVRSIGVCNFKAHHLEALLQTAEVMPAIDQMELHPGFCEEDTVSYCREHHIRVEASSPLGNGRILGNAMLARIAERHEKTPAQICLRWELEKGFAVIPKTQSRERLAENADVFDFELTEEERKQIDEIPYCGGLGIDPDEVTEFG